MIDSSLGTTITRSPRETFHLGYSLGRSLNQPRIFFLEGGLGVGKTVFAKGLICGLGQASPDDVLSPSFTLINEYLLRFKVYHIDLYRLNTAQDFMSLDLDEILTEPAVIVVEWAEKLRNVDWEGIIHVKFEDLGENLRRIDVSVNSESARRNLA